LFGRAVASDADEAELLETRRRIGLVFSHGGRLFRDQTVLGNISVPLRYHLDLSLDEAESRAESLAELLGLKPWLHRSAINLPLVWQQRTALARALALRPEVLFLDRPLSALDFSHRGWWLEFLTELAAGFDGQPPVTVVVGSDSMKPWLGIASKFAHISDGRWETVADPAAGDHDVRDVTRHFTRAKS
jgi:ABC-type methionine transport system ATPase subunit